MRPTVCRGFCHAWHFMVCVCVVLLSAFSYMKFWLKILDNGAGFDVEHYIGGVKWVKVERWGA